jgi:hypothetical protein
MAVSTERHRALRLLAGSPLGVTEVIMLAQGFTNATLDTLVRGGLATRNSGKCGQGGSRRPVWAKSGMLVHAASAAVIFRRQFQGSSSWMCFAG